MGLNMFSYLYRCYSTTELLTIPASDYTPFLNFFFLNYTKAFVCTFTPGDTTVLVRLKAQLHNRVKKSFSSRISFCFHLLSPIPSKRKSHKSHCTKIHTEPTQEVSPDLHCNSL